MNETNADLLYENANEINLSLNSYGGLADNNKPLESEILNEIKNDNPVECYESFIETNQKSSHYESLRSSRWSITFPSSSSNENSQTEHFNSSNENVQHQIKFSRKKNYGKQCENSNESKVVECERLSEKKTTKNQNAEYNAKMENLNQSKLSFQ